MRRIITFPLLTAAIITVFLFGVFPMPVQAQTTAPAEQIDSFSSNLTLASNSDLTVAETITYNFGDTQHHGIYRDLPYRYSRSGTRYNVRITILSVTNEQGTAWPYTTRRWAGDLRLTIGDANAYVTGIQVYKITYRLERAINYFNDHDELYWNVTGNGWQVPVKQASASIQVPANVKKEQWQLACYTGPAGSKDQACSQSVSNEQTSVFETTTGLNPAEGLTLVVGFPKGIISKPGTAQQLTWFLADNWPLLIPLLVLAVMFYLWYARGRDPRVQGETIIPQYEPPDRLPAAEVGTIVDERADLKDISATVIQLAVKGYLKIREIEEKKLLSTARDYELIKLKEADKALRNFESEVFNGIFDAGATRTVSSLKNKFYTHLKDIKNKLYEAVILDGYFPSSPERVRQGYGVLGMVVIFFGGFLLFGLANTVAGIATLVSGVVALLFARVMPRKTAKGAATHHYILGFKWFLSVTETERLKFHNAPAKSPKEFEELLPYAMVLDVEKEWAKQFAGIYLSPPEWYEGHPGTAFGAWYLATSLGSMSSSMNTAMVAAPRGTSTAGFGGSGFGGGGFSGGGFGGGGGGSW